MALRLKKTILACIGGAFLALAFMQGCAREGISSLIEARSRTGYKVVLMDSGQIFFGRLDKGIQGYVVLKDVYYIPRGLDRKTGRFEIERIKGQLTDNAKFLPETIYLDSRHVMLMETLSPDSKVIGLIEREQGNKGG